MKRRIAFWLAGVVALAAGLAGAAGATGATDLPLGAGDVVKMSVYGSPDLALETRVSETGTITFPLIGQVDVAGLSVAAAEQKLGGLLESGGYLKKAQVNMIVTTLASRQVSVLGWVNRPGRYAVDGRRSVLDLLALAGGISPDGDESVSLIRRRDGGAGATRTSSGTTTSTERIDVVQMVRSGTLDQDLQVAGGDVIYVERAPRFYIVGEVQRPGAFRIERGMTVRQALSAGGGLTARGTERGLQIARRDADGKSRMLAAGYDDLVQVDDVITVKESWF